MSCKEVLQPYNELISGLCCNAGWGRPLRNYNGSWIPEVVLPGTLAFRDRFKARDTDIFVITQPKSGTTWLKALTFATVNREVHDPCAKDHPLLRMNPHDCIPFMDDLYGQGDDSQLDSLASPRLLHSHATIQNLPESVVSSDCKIIYFCRDPKDTLVSLWHFVNRLIAEGKEPISLDVAYELYCNGVSPFGPVWEHQLVYWKESLNMPRKVLFLKYEEMMEDTIGNLRKLAEFVGFPFSKVEEEEGVVEEIVNLCSFPKLSRLDVNQTSGGHKVINKIIFKNSYYFRKGNVGDWKNHLTLEMARRVDEITQQKLHGSGLTFCTHVDTLVGARSIQSDRDSLNEAGGVGARVSAETNTESEPT